MKHSLQATNSSSTLKSSSRRYWWFGGSFIFLLFISLYYLFLVRPSDFRWRAIYGEPSYPKGYKVHGIDISRYQENINWSLLSNAMIDKKNIRFVFIKATEGDNHVDKYFKQNFKNAKEYGLIRGAYHFWSNKSSAKRQAFFFIAMTQLRSGDLPPVLDVETAPQHMSIKTFQENLLTWLEIVEKEYKVKPIIYTYSKFKQEYLSDARFDKYPYWIAHYYIKEMKYRGQWSFWQHTDVGKLPGIKGYVDLNVFNGNYTNLQQMLIPAPTPVETQDSTNLDTHRF